MGRSRRRALIAAGALAVVAAIDWLLAFRTGVGAQADEALLEHLLGFSDARSHALAGFGDPGPVAVLTAGIIAVALARRRADLAVMAVIAIAGANLTSQVLKVITAEPRAIESPGAHIAAESWPSGHATAAMSVALGLLAVVPAAVRPVAAALGGGFAIGVAGSVMLLGWHLPSDVLGGFSVAGAWMLIAAAILMPRSSHDARQWQAPLPESEKLRPASGTKRQS